MSESAHILVVDDDARLRALLSRYLGENGFRVTTAESAVEARAMLRSFAPDLLVLDVMMPDENGLALTEQLRQTASLVPILLLTARAAPEDRIAGFEAGADDYLPKPFEPLELVLRIRAMLRRAIPAGPVLPAGPVTIGAAWFDAGRGELRGPNGPIRLTAGETALLGALARRPMRCCRAKTLPPCWAWTRRASARWTSRSRGCAGRSSPTRASLGSC